MKRGGKEEEYLDDDDKALLESARELAVSSELPSSISPRKITSMFPTEKLSS